MPINQFPHIVSNPAILDGKPCIAGTRISVDIVLEWIASGASIKDITKLYPHLSELALKDAVQYAASYLKNEIIIEVKLAA